MQRSKVAFLIGPCHFCRVIFPKLQVVYISKAFKSFKLQKILSECHQVFSQSASRSCKCSQRVSSASASFIRFCQTSMLIPSLERAWGCRGEPPCGAVRSRGGPSVGCVHAQGPPTRPGFGHVVGQTCHLELWWHKESPGRIAHDSSCQQVADSPWEILACSLVGTWMQDILYPEESQSTLYTRFVSKGLCVEYAADPWTQQRLFLVFA